MSCQWHFFFLLEGLDTDDFMAKGKTDSQGHFRISGHINEISPIDPKINIYHDCNDGYISSGKVPSRFYNAGTIELAGKFKGETRDCIH
ncbi:unnamed protein product [Gongylonema pulchrum]|uniref:Transthyretin-like family protein n=1 Tax=Gongylonema pulchrum TaxID=637853 RepID=A0A183E4W5_9BILA|nr:unnamed protein product [Gongylonema pulchrum]